MPVLERDSREETLFRAGLGVAVLAIAITCANFSSLPIDFTMFEARLADPDVRRAFVAGYTLQLATGSGLAMALVLDATRVIRPAMYAWFVSLCLLFVPVPAFIRNPGTALLPITIVATTAVLGWVLDESLREGT